MTKPREVFPITKEQAFTLWVHAHLFVAFCYLATLIMAGLLMLMAMLYGNMPLLLPEVIIVLLVLQCVDTSVRLVLEQSRTRVLGARDPRIADIYHQP